MKPFFIAPAPLHAWEGSTTPTFSVGIVAYKVAHLLGHAVAPALAQTTPPLEVVVCDDGSTGEIDRALQPYRDQIIFIRQENRVEGAANKAAVGAASGESASVCGDNVSLPARLKALGALADQRPDLDTLTTDAHLEVEGRREDAGPQGDHLEPGALDLDLRSAAELGARFERAAVSVWAARFLHLVAYRGARHNILGFAATRV